MVLMADPKFLNEIIISYDVASDVSEKLKAFLSASNGIKQYHFIITGKQHEKCLNLHPDGDRCQRCPADRKWQGYEHPRQHGAGRQDHDKDRRQSPYRDLAGKENLRGEEYIGGLRSLVGYSLGKILQAHVQPFSGQRNDRLPLWKCKRPIQRKGRPRHKISLQKESPRSTMKTSSCWQACWSAVQLQNFREATCVQELSPSSTPSSTIVMKIEDTMTEK